MMRDMNGKMTHTCGTDEPKNEANVSIVTITIHIGWEKIKRKIGAAQRAHINHFMLKCSKDTDSILMRMAKLRLNACPGPVHINKVEWLLYCTSYQIISIKVFLVKERIWTVRIYVSIVFRMLCTWKAQFNMESVEPKFNAHWKYALLKLPIYQAMLSNAMNLFLNYNKYYTNSHQKLFYQRWISEYMRMN